MSPIRGWATDKEFDRMKLAMPVNEGWLYEKNKKFDKIICMHLMIKMMMVLLLVMGLDTYSMGYQNNSIGG